MQHDWVQVAERHYNLRACALVEHLKHHKDHYVLRAGGERYVLSTAAIDPRRPPHAWHFVAMQALNAAGFWQVRLPCPTLDGRPYAVHDGNWWMLRWYGMSDESPDWAAPPLITDAARTLAALHDAAERIRSHLPPPPLPPDALDPYHWNVPEVVERVAALERRAAARFDREERSELRAALDRLACEAPRTLTGSEALGLVGLTHQDFRPANLRVLRGRIRELLDWDLVRVDHSLYDLAFGCLQFLGRERLLPAPDLDGGAVRALGFVAGYAAAREAAGLRSAIPPLLPWYLRYTILKRTLISVNGRERLLLLRQVERSPLVSEAALADALAPAQPAGTLVMEPLAMADTG
jgi:Ser/Thr protein kinase RdoA (MazF antagonist)